MNQRLRGLCVESVSAKSAEDECKMEAAATHGRSYGASWDTRKWLVSREIESLSALPVLKSNALAVLFHRCRDNWRGGDSESDDGMVSSWDIALPCR